MGKPLVTVKEGKLEGAVLKSSLGLSYIAFRGIPFAAPPIGNLRFRDPQPPAPWTGILDTSKDTKYMCPQLEENPPFDVIGNEDCLYLNVYTNSLDQSKPVMFWIHGGAFMLGNSSFHESRPDYLLAKDVVVVSANYRLGAFGFLNLGHRIAPGNLGLKDLIIALEWVKKNIANFGGDSNNVTIFGVSAGATLVHSLLVSPRAKGLFHKAILQSGTLTCPWANFEIEKGSEGGFKLASLLGKVSNDPVEVFEFLRTVPAEDIVKAQLTLLSPEREKASILPFRPNSDEVAENPVLPEPVEQLITKEADVPVIISHTAHEYLMIIKDPLPHNCQIVYTTIKHDICSYTVGASHTDDVAYLLYLPKCKTEHPDPPAIGTKDRITLERMTRMWTNFATTGNPTSVKDEFVNVDWKPATEEDLCYLKIDDELQLLPISPHLLSSK
ncbi:esterase FE4-like isoform X2 [Bombus flavifrons]|uniref:esterase FE4-like isoform X2 n=1 Tax=Bombus flavifrons TaxID=103934 RepID=UPI003703EA5E